MPSNKIDILLIYPSCYPGNPGADFDIDYERCVPMGVISLGAYLEYKGLKVAILDCRLYPKQAIDILLERYLDCGVDLVGFSVMTVQVAHALELTNKVKAANPKLPVIWGGGHPTLFPQQTADEDIIDYVMEGEGEENLWLLYQAIKNKGSVGTVPGLSYKTAGKVTTNVTPKLIIPDDMPVPAYHLLDIERYLDRSLLDGRQARTLDVLISRGCPYRCAFCLNTSHLGRRWRPVSADKAAGQIKSLIKKYRLENVWFMDDFFFGDIRRAEKIITDSFSPNSQITWEANIRADNFSQDKVNIDSLKCYRDRGCYALRMGAESGVDRVLKLIKKDITTAQITAAVEMCQKTGIIPFMTFMMGIPGEKLDEIIETVAFTVNLKDRYPLALPAGAPGIYRPYPGGELYRTAIAEGLKEPQSLKEWAHWYSGNGGYLSVYDLPWVAEKSLLEDIGFYMTNYWLKDNAVINNFRMPLFHKLVAHAAGWRARNKYWNFRVEARIRDALKRLARH